MQKDQDTVEGLLHCLDSSISDRNRRYKTLDNQYKNANGHVLSSEFDEYTRRKNAIKKQFGKEAIEYQEKLDNLCKRIRKTQPSLLELSEININKRGRFPRNIALGKLHVKCENLDFYVPKVFSFPFERPMYICDESKIILLHKVLLRLLFALPAEKQEYYVFDPIGLGKTVSKFNSLFSVEQLFPQKKVLSSTMELKEALKDVLSYILDLQSNVFNIQTDCQDWDSYNRRLYSQNNKRKMLPYKVFIFTSVPDGMDEECFNMFKTLIAHGKQCGLLVLFSFNEAVLETDEYKMRKTEIELKTCISQSEKLHVVFEQEDSENQYECLNVNNVGEKFPEDANLYYLLTKLKEATKNLSEQGMSFDELMEQGVLFDRCSRDGLVVPIGCGASGSSRIDLMIDDSTTHYLIGGTTGSGKSNLLHNLIISACSRYSPEELNVYLLDFKEGVEFNQYANPNLSHAKLVATEADTEYGITVLSHLVELKENRYKLFKNEGCKDIQGYRKKNPTEVMPRILVVVDEFQVLFGNAQKDQTISTLEMLAKQGRACGIHLVMATQSLKGIDFATLGPQFSGRIALRCSAEDSKILLGGVTSNNEAAAELKVPYAIINTTNGNISGNIKFSVPKAEESKIAERIDLFNQKCLSLNINVNTKVFEGQSLPMRPEKMDFLNKNKLQLVLGELMDYSAKEFVLELRPKVTENLLICGRDAILKESLFVSVVKSAINSEQCDEIVYIGDNLESLVDDTESQIVNFISIKDFIETIKDTPYEKRRIVIIDNCNIKKQIGYDPAMANYLKDESSIFFKEYLNDANSKGTYLVAFYERTSQIKNFGVPKDEFNYRIGYSINIDEKNFLLGTGFQSQAPVKENRAFFVDNLEIKAWFRPYANRQGEEI